MDQPGASTNVVSHFDRTILKEPSYRSTPKYSLITPGNGGDVKVWMVQDRKRLFLDRNSNGDNAKVLTPSVNLSTDVQGNALKIFLGEKRKNGTP